MEELITGYTWMANGAFGGAYQFPNNKDKEEIHVPPHTTLIAPPAVEQGKEAYWTGSAWDIRDIVPLS
ncbi:MAG: hypothetical protein ACXWT5_06050 [Methylophilus sp.]